ncbi:HAD family hydrolase [Candidatus Micrarchaeota archaeon]|nr:HAD family hydrolase [Candidatus Micrarchaeota archaeon]
MSKVTVIVFDLWNTLVYNTCTPTLPQLVKQELGLSALSHREFVRHYDESFCLHPGTEFEEALGELARRCNVPLAAEKRAKLRQAMEALLDCVDAFADTMPTLEKLRRQGYKLAVLSNTTYLGLEYALQKVPLHDAVDEIITSYDESVIKPDPRMFLAVQKRFDVRPSEILMVGDNLHNDVQAARDAGWHAVHVDRFTATPHPDTLQGLEGLFSVLEKIKSTGQHP